MSIIRFISFITEKLEGDLGNHESGTFHEILVAHALNGNKHVNDLAQRIHDDYANRIGGTSSSLYQHHLARAQEAANTIRQDIESQGHEISHISWTPKASEKEAGHEDSSDIYVHTKSGKSIGTSLKVGDKHGNKPISNPGSTPEMKGFLEASRRELEDIHPETRSMSVQQIKQHSRNNPEVGKTVDRLRKAALRQSVDHLYDSYSQMSEPELHQHVMKLLHAGPTYEQNHIRVTTTGTGGNYRSRVIRPATYYNPMIQLGKIEVQRSGTSVIFKHKDTGKILAKHRLKFESSGLTSIKGSGESPL